MSKWVIVVSFCIISVAYAEVGKISKVLGSNDSYLLRNNEKSLLTSETLLEEGDEIFSEEGVIQIHLYPSTQMSLAKHSQIKITQNLIEETEEKEKTFSVIEYIKGIVRLQVTKDSDQEIEQKVQANGVAFAVRGTEFEVSQEGDDVDLDVIEGQVEVSSPYVQTFVPEVVKANEGFRFNKKARQFHRRQFRMKFKDHPRFASREEMKLKWKKKRMERRQKQHMRQANKKFQTRQQKNARKNKK